MKTIKYLSIALLAVSFSLSSCGEKKADSGSSSDTPSATPPNADQSTAKSYKVDTSKSIVNWTGTKFGVYDHTGTLNLSSGDITIKGNEIVSGGLVVDMTSMATTDDNYDEEHPSEGLLGHLAQDVFFDIANYKTAMLGFVGDGQANLSIKDKTNKVEYTDLKIEDAPGGGKKLTAKAEFNRQDYGVTFKIGEAFANDIVKLDVELLVR